MISEPIPQLRRAGISAILGIWGGLALIEIVHHPSVLTDLSFYLGLLILFWVTILGTAIVGFWSNYFYKKEQWIPGAFIWLVVPFVLLNIFMASVSHWHGFRLRDWAPVFVLTTVCTIVTYLKYLHGTRWAKE